jgi:hypothetical protein
VRLDLLRLAGKLVRGTRVLENFALGRPVRELEMGVGDDRLLQIRVDARTASPVGSDEFELDPGAVVLVPLDEVFFEDVGLVLAGVDPKLDLSSRAPLARLRENHDRLAGGEHGVKTGGADADALLAAGLLEPVELRPVKELRENLGNLFLHDARAVVFDADAVPVLGDLGDVDRDRRQDARLLAGIEGVVDRLLDRGQQGLGGVVEPE